MSNLDDLVTVIRLACLTEDRDPDEQRALLRLAVRCDTEWNAPTVTNTATWGRDQEGRWYLRRPLLHLADEVRSTRVLCDGARPVDLPSAQVAKEAKRHERWARMADTGLVEVADADVMDRLRSGENVPLEPAP